MRLVELFEGELRFDESTEVGFPAHGDDGDVSGYVQGDGAVNGTRLSGRLRWTNHPRRRADGTWLPDFHGVISTDDGADVLFSFRGYNWEVSDPVPEMHMPSEHRAAVAALTLAAADERYRWVNRVFAVIEADVRPLADPEHWRVRAFECVNELTE